jgi:hypothetical protein
MPSDPPDVVKSRGPPAATTFESDAHTRRPKVAARMPQSFTAMSPRHADEDESNVGEAEEEEYDDDFEEAEAEEEPLEGGSEEPTEEELEDSMLNEMLDELHSRKNSDVQKRMNEHGRNWRLVNSKANNELSEKLEDQTRQREERAHSKLRVAKTTQGGSGSAAAKARRHQMAFVAAKKRSKAQARFLRKHKVFAGILEMIVGRCNAAQLSPQQQAEEDAAVAAGGPAKAPPPSRPRPTPVEKIVLAKLKIALLERAGLEPRSGPPSAWEKDEPNIIPGPNGVIDPRKVVLHKMVGRDIFYSSLANDSVLPLEAFAEVVRFFPLSVIFNRKMPFPRAF